MTHTEPEEGTDRRAWIAQIMGMPISVHLRGSGARGGEADLAVTAVFAALRDADAMFSTYRDDSEICRLWSGELTLAECSAPVEEVRRLCRTASERTDGYFDAWASVPGNPGTFDPTGLVKSWAVSRAARHLARLDGLGYVVNAGGDVLVHSASGVGPWRVGIEDPHDRDRTIAVVPLDDGAVATSGTAARGAHILDPHTGEPCTEVLSATVVGPSMIWADVWATTAVARGAAAVDWVETLHGTAGLLVLAGGEVHRWSNPV